MRAALTGFRSRATLVLALLALGGVALQSVSGSALGAGKTSCRHISLYAEELPNSPQGEIRIGYGLTPSTAKIPGPLIEMTEGQCLRVKLTNDVSAPTLQKLKEKYGGDSELPLAVSIHPHGAKYERTSDGTLSSNSFVMPGQTKTFTWSAPANTAGYWWYHDHVVGTEHGTGGLTSGLWGGLIIRRPGDLRPDAPTFVVAMGDNFTINLERYPDVPSFVARQGQRIEFLVFAWGNETHAFHLHGHTWADNRTGIFDPGSDTPATDNKTLAPGSSFGFQVIAGLNVGPNRWMYHCHVQFHSDLGMMGYLVVKPA